MGKITLRTIAGLQPNSVVWDEVRGFGCRRQRRDAVFFIKTRVGGKQIYHTIGCAGSPWSPEQARREAKRLLGSPEALVRAPSGEGSPIRAYLSFAKRTLRPRSYEAAEWYLLRHWADMALDRRSIAAALTEIERESGPSAARRSRGVLSACMRWAIANGLAETNPVAGTIAPKERSRDRVLRPAELRAIWLAAGHDGDATLDVEPVTAVTVAYGRIVRLLILTGARRAEVGGMRWSELGPEGIWRLPPERTKNGRPHAVPLTPLALAQLPPPMGDYVFGLRPFTAWSQAKAALDVACGVRDWTIHDIRRTCAMGLAELGILPHIVETVLNHVGHKSGVAGIYNRARYEADCRAALTAWANHVAEIVGKGKA